MKPRKGVMPVLDFIKHELSIGRDFPTNAAIAKHMGWTSAGSAGDALMRLAAHGHLKVAERKPAGRGWTYVYEVV